MAKYQKSRETLKMPTSLALEYRDMEVFYNKQYSLSRLMQLICMKTRGEDLNITLREIWSLATDGRFKPEDFS